LCDIINIFCYRIISTREIETEHLAREDVGVYLHDVHAKMMREKDTDAMIN
jgi:hypothetical protein